MLSFGCSVVDCRSVQLELEFDNLTQIQLKKLAAKIFEKCVSVMQNEFYLCWDWNGKNIKEDHIPFKIQEAEGYFTFGFEGEVFSETVSDAKTFKLHSKSLFDKAMMGIGSILSVDYYDGLRSIEPSIISAITPDETKTALLNLFNCPQKKKIGIWNSYDTVFLFSSYPYENNQKLFYGDVSLRVAALCLGEHIIDFSNMLAICVRQIAEEFETVSGRVTLSPISLPNSSCGHMLYFGRLANQNIREVSNLTVREWARRYYVRGAEWFNVLSPVQSQQLSCFRNVSYADMCVETLSTGGVMVASNKNILQTDIPELLSVKKFLYPALFPGEGVLFLEHLLAREHVIHTTKPRREWEYVPMLEEEIIVLSDKVVFRHYTNCEI